MKRFGYVFVSALLSLFLHFLLLVFADRIHMTNATYLGEPEMRRVQVGSVDIRDLVWKRKKRKELTNQEAETQLKQAVRNSGKVKEIFTDARLAEAPKPKLRLAGLGRNILAPELPEPEKARPATAPRPKILEINASDVPRERLAMQRPFTKKLMRQYIPGKRVPSMLSPGTLSGGIGATLDVGMRLGGLPGTPGLRVGDLPPEEQGRGGGGLAAGASGATFAPVGGIPRLEGVTRTGNRAERIRINGERAEILYDFVTVTVTIYRERDGSGYFRADIAPNPRSDVLRDVPKDILFLIDHSTSISAAKLARFKAATIEALEYLNPRDRFNVVSFTDRPESLYTLWKPVTPESVREGQEYVRRLMRGGMTDVFNSLAPYIRSSNGIKERPLNVFLMSDGNSTVNIRSDDFFVRRILKMNPGNVSIYPFSAGRRVNRDLFDFLAYHNRGMSLHVDKLEEFKDTLVDYISSHSSLIVADLRYHASDELATEIFPKRLPHLYRGETLSLWGTFPKQVKELTLSLVGRDGSGQLRELLFRKPLDECRRGTADIAKEWAAQKIFHLLGQRTLTTDAIEQTKLQARIRQLSREFGGIMVPY